jgi:hypothetical protein
LDVKEGGGEREREREAVAEGLRTVQKDRLCNLYFSPTFYYGNQIKEEEEEV